MSANGFDNSKGAAPDGARAATERLAAERLAALRLIRTATDAMATGRGDKRLLEQAVRLLERAVDLATLPAAPGEVDYQAELAAHESRLEKATVHAAEKVLKKHPELLEAYYEEVARALDPDKKR